MIIKWNEKDQIREQQRLELLLKNESTSSNDKKEIKLALNMYKSLLQNDYEELINLAEQKIINSQNNKKRMEFINDEFEIYNKTQKDLAMSIRKALDEFVLRNAINSYYDQIDTKTKQNIKTNQELFEQSYEIYKKINKTYSKDLDNIYKNNLMKISKNKDLISCTYMDYYNKKAYGIFVPKDNDYTDENIYNHELTHIIDAIHMKFNRKNQFINEFHPSFIGLITDYNNYITTNDNNYIKSQINYLNHIKGKIFFSNIATDSLAIKNLTFNKEKKMLSNKYSINITDNEKILDNLSSCEYQTITNYLLSGILTLHLFDIYKEDKEKAIYLFNKSLLNQEENITDFLKNLEFNFKDANYYNYIFEKNNSEIKNIAKKRKIIK